jgi:uncharacterized protein (DUF111 family)
MDPEMFGNFLEVALDAGALDVFFSPIQMKKNRPGTLLSLLCRPADEALMARLIFRETTTLGMRVSHQRRWCLPRTTRLVQTEWGAVRVKESSLDGEVVNAYPEYEDLRRIAKESGLTLKQMRQRILRDID